MWLSGNRRLTIYSLCRLNDIQRATTAKSSVEQIQRDEAKARKETNTAWRTRVSGQVITLRVEWRVTNDSLYFAELLLIRRRLELQKSAFEANLREQVNGERNPDEAEGYGRDTIKL